MSPEIGIWSAIRSTHEAGEAYGGLPELGTLQSACEDLLEAQGAISLYEPYQSPSETRGISLTVRREDRSFLDINMCLHYKPDGESGQHSLRGLIIRFFPDGGTEIIIGAEAVSDEDANSISENFCYRLSDGGWREPTTMHTYPTPGENLSQARKRLLAIGALPVDQMPVRIDVLETAKEIFALVSKQLNQPTISDDFPLVPLN